MPADGAYDARYNREGMREREIEFVPGICRNAVAVSKGCMVRSSAVVERDGMGDKEWKDMHGYGTRRKVESVFSDLKRMFGDSIRPHGTEYMVPEVGRMVALFNRLKDV